MDKMVEELIKNAYHDENIAASLESLLFTDALTRLGNRAAFTRELKALHGKQGVICVMLDINGLKFCNDRYGHGEGDHLIMDTADCIHAAFAPIGKCYRIGGDEFSVLAADAQLQTVTGAIEAFTRCVEEKNQKRTMPLSVAIGYAVRENPEEDLELTINRADKWMYEMKSRTVTDLSQFSEDQTRVYRSVLEIMSQTTDDFLFLQDIKKDENWFFGAIDQSYALRNKGKPTNTTAEKLAIIHPVDRKAYADDIEKIRRGEKNFHNMNYRWINRQGQAVWVNSRGRVINDQDGKPFILIGRVSESTLRHLYNPLTGLWNTQKMREDIQKKLQEEPGGYLMLLEINDLTAINLSRGRSYGDELLKELANDLETLPFVTNAYHIEYNNFAVIIASRQEADVRSVYLGIQEKMQEKCTFTASAVPINGEIFVDANNLYDSLKLTLNKAKAAKKSTLEFFSTQEIDEKILSLELLDELQESVRNNCEGFELYYQPQVNGGDYHVCAMEALIRYRSKNKGMLFPDKFIPLLEQTHLINAVGLWVLEQALLQCKKWRESIPDLSVSVNFSIVQFEDSYLADRVLRILEKTGMPGSALTVEITESIKLHESTQFSSIVKYLKSAGIQISIDDFGTGYSNLGYLKQIHADEIKIDRIFVNSIEKGTYNYTLISNIIEFAKTNNIRVCCEGVESIRELTILGGLQPELLQGYLFDKPCCVQDIEKAYIDPEAPAYRQRMDFIQKIYQLKEKMGVIHFDPKDILRLNDIGLWIIRINAKENHYEMHADATMERIMAVDRKYTPQECYDHWHSHIVPEYLDYVHENVRIMTEIDKVVQLEYPWIHPEFGEVIVRCNGRRVADSDGMIVLEGYHRILSDVECVPR